jgi:hypothetical protein
VRQLFGIGPASDGLDCTGAPEVGEPSLVPLAEDAGPDITEVIAEGVFGGEARDIGFDRG